MSRQRRHSRLSRVRHAEDAVAASMLDTVSREIETLAAKLAAATQSDQAGSGMS